MEWIESNTNITINLIDKIIYEPITKLTSTYKLIEPSESSNIDDQTLSWICENLENLFETDDISLAMLDYEDKLYSISKVRENILINDTNVYENQVVHGFISTLKLAASNLLAGYESTPTSIGKESTNDEYYSFFNQIKNFINRLILIKLKNAMK